MLKSNEARRIIRGCILLTAVKQDNKRCGGLDNVNKLLELLVQWF